MPDKPEPARPAEAGTFPLTPFTDFSRFDKLAPGNDKKPGDQQTPSSTVTIPPIGDGKPKPTEPAPKPADTQPKPFQPFPPLVFPPVDATKPKPVEPAPKPGDQRVTPPIVFPPIDARPPRPERPADQIKPQPAPDAGDQSIKVGPNGKIEITEKDFEKIGPKAAQALKDAGVTKLTITPGQGFDTYEAELKKPLEVPQDPNIDGCRKLKIGTSFKADVVKNADGTLQLDNIQGLTAETKILFKWQDASVDKIKLRQLPDGQSEITSTGSWNGFSRDNTRVKPAEIFEKANFLFDKMDKIKSGAKGGGGGSPSFLEIPKLR